MFKRLSTTLYTSLSCLVRNLQLLIKLVAFDATGMSRNVSSEKKIGRDECRVALRLRIKEGKEGRMTKFSWVSNEKTFLFFFFYGSLGDFLHRFKCFTINKMLCSLVEMVKSVESVLNVLLVRGSEVRCTLETEVQRCRGATNKLKLLTRKETP